MYSVALILACFTTTVLTETDAENDDSQIALQAANRALLNDLDAAKATIETQDTKLKARNAEMGKAQAKNKALIAKLKAQLEEQGAKLEAHGQGIKAPLPPPPSWLQHC